jgi:hypothetical protein
MRTLFLLTVAGGMLFSVLGCRTTEPVVHQSCGCQSSEGAVMSGSVITSSEPATIRPVPAH